MASSSSSSSIILQSKYDVFLNFRGEDTRNNFTSHLYAALCRKQIQTFIDDEGLQRGEEISPALLKAIEESKISVIIFSKDYASSKWCLDELVKILECKKMHGQTVMPVFYHISPSDVRNQTGSFEDPFAKHEKDFKEIPEKVQRWKVALTKASNLSGWDSMMIRSESKLVEEIVKEILKKLNDISSSSNCGGLVGGDSRINDINSLLKIGLSDIRIVGIWGMGGIGKTTIVGAVFHKISIKFQGCFFIANVREESKRCGLIHVRNQVLSQILEEQNLAIGTPSIPKYIKRRLQVKKILLVYDDVDDLTQLELLVGDLPQFGPGSRIIVITRDKQVLTSYGVDHIYEVKRLEDHEALQLFCNYAFKNNHPLGELEALSRRITDHAKGNPLALKVLGSSLYQKSKKEWETTMCKLMKISNPNIHNMLIVSFNGLDVEQKNIFLDIACFFRGWNINYVTKIVDSCYNASHFGLSVLIDKSLIFTTEHNKIEMHDLLQEMGWEIVHQESPQVLGKRSRLWNHEDVFHVLRNNSGTDAIEGLFLDMSKITHLSSKAFENMPNLKFLRFHVPDQHFGKVADINKVHLPQGLKYLPDELRYLHWHGYPLDALPPNFSPKNLIELNLPCSNVDEKLWLETKHGSKRSYCPQLERCQSLLDVSLTIKHLTNLRFLNLSGCRSIRSFPSNIHFRSLITLRLSHCINLTRFPEISGTIKELYLDRTAIDEVPSSIACLTELNKLQLWSCRRLKKISTSIYKLTSLEDIALTGNIVGKCQFSSSIAFWKEIRYLSLGCGNIKEIPEDIFGLSSLKVLDLVGNKFKSLPTSIKHLTQLRHLILTNCRKLESIQELPLTLTCLEAAGCSQLQSIPEPPSELKVASNRWNMQSIFTNCMKLNQNADSNILTNSQQRIQHMAALVLRLYHAEVFDKMLNFSLCLPGNEIPEWFSHKSSRSSITIELPQHWRNRRFVGLALSAVLAFEENFPKRQALSVLCSYHFQDNNTKSVTFNWDCVVTTPYFPSTSNDVTMLIESNHIALGYSPCFMHLKGDYTTATFQYRVFDYKKRSRAKGAKLKYCGVHLL